MRQDNQQRHSLHFIQSTHRQQHQATVPSLGIDAFDRGRALLIKLLGLIGDHPFPPVSHRWAVSWLALVRIDGRLGVALRIGLGVGLRRSGLRLRFWLGHRGNHPSLCRDGINRVVCRKPAIHPPVVGRLSSAAHDLLHHGSHLPHVTAVGDDIDADNDLTFGVAAKFDVVPQEDFLRGISWSEYAIAPRHHCRFGVGVRGAGFFRLLALPLLDVGQFGQARQGGCPVPFRQQRLQVAGAYFQLLAVGLCTRAIPTGLAFRCGKAVAEV